MSCQKGPILLEPPKKIRRFGGKHLYTSTQSTIYCNLVFPVRRETPVCVVSLVRRTEVPAPEIAPRVPQITIIHLEISEVFKQRRQAFKDKNHPLRKINQVVIVRTQNRDTTENEISDAGTIILDLESEKEPMSEYSNSCTVKILGQHRRFKFTPFHHH